MYIIYHINNNIQDGYVFLRRISQKLSGVKHKTTCPTIRRRKNVIVHTPNPFVYGKL